MNFERSTVVELMRGLEKAPNLIHVAVGPRQVGKTTAARQLCRRFPHPHYWAAADAPLPPGPEWIETHWRLASSDSARTGKPVLLVLDEIQKVHGWSETIKALWDGARAKETQLRVVLLGSSALLVQHGLTESMAGRYYLHRCMHWTWAECRDAFGWSLEQWLFFGGYPGASIFVDNESEWRRYVADSMIEAVLSRDVFQLAPVTKPVLMRHLFGLAAQFPAQILSYNKMLGQLQDAGNTTTLAHYLHLLESAFLLSGLEQYSSGQIRKRGSSPKLIFWNNALISALAGHSRDDLDINPSWRGRIVENAVGAHLLNGLHGAEWTVAYWRDRHDEMDFVVRRGVDVWGIEVKSGRSDKPPSTGAFQKRYPDAHVLIVGSQGIDLETFFSRDAVSWFE